MTFITRLIPILLSAVLLLSACQTTSVPDRVISLEEFFTPPSDKVVSTADSVVVKGIKTAYVKELLKVDFKLLNNRGRRNVINYRIQWFDKDGMVTGTYGSWMTTALEGQQEIILTVLAPNKYAIDYKLELQTN